MASALELDQDPQQPPNSRKRFYLAGGVIALLVIAVGVGIFASVQASNAEEEALLADGVDRSSLPSDQAVALATLVQTRGEPLGHDEGHQHSSMSMGHEMTSAEMEELAAQVAAATEAIPKWNTLAEAEADGYRQTSGVSNGSGAHYTKWSIVDRPFDPAEPSQLLFDVIEFGAEPELIAFSYWVSSHDEPEGFAGRMDVWHRHRGMCFENAWLVDENIPNPNDCDGDWINGEDLWMLHAWVVPGLENRFGQFAAVNPLLCEGICGMEN